MDGMVRRKKAFYNISFTRFIIEINNGWYGMNIKLAGETFTFFAVNVNDVDVKLVGELLLQNLIAGYGVIHLLAIRAVGPV